MMKRIHLAAVEAALRLAAGTAAAEGIGGSGFTRSGIAKPPMMTRVLTAAMREAMQAQRSPQPTYDGWSFVGGEAGRVRSPQATSATQVAARGARDDARFDGQKLRTAGLTSTAKPPVRGTRTVTDPGTARS